MYKENYDFDKPKKKNLLNKHTESLLIIGKAIDRLYFMKFKGIC